MLSLWAFEVDRGRGGDRHPVEGVAHQVRAEAMRARIRASASSMDTVRPARRSAGPASIFGSISGVSSKSSGSAPGSSPGSSAGPWTGSSP
ncbi:MAG: hypothetical protein Q8S73_16020 [Deltaproteobacteria bacterium]|nr:hypothetical protein [Myxococcales bacterium]MDP3215614.1 hypothetical protein [Deltaproteobacteria bacterium]